MGNTHAVIVTYHPDLDVVRRNINNLLACQSVDAVNVIDNTPTGTDLESLESERVTVVLLGENKGIAFAQNVGLQIGLDAAAEYIVLFDQDSDISPDLVSELMAAMRDAKASGMKLACVGPRPVDIFSGKKCAPIIQREKKLNSNITVCSQIIASGKLIDAEVLRSIGMMEDSLFIDGVDHEWCWRARRNGYQVAIAENAIMEHTLGDDRGRLLCFTYKIGSAIRMYYQFRNILILVRRGYVPLYWKIRNLFGIAFRFIVFSFGKSDSRLRRKYMIQGIIDGVLKCTGPYRSR